MLSRQPTEFLKTGEKTRTILLFYMERRNDLYLLYILGAEAYAAVDLDAAAHPLALGDLFERRAPRDALQQRLDHGARSLKLWTEAAGLAVRASILEPAPVAARDTVHRAAALPQVLGGAR